MNRRGPIPYLAAALALALCAPAVLASKADKAAALTSSNQKLAAETHALKVRALLGDGGASRAIAAPAPKLTGTAALLATPLPAKPAPKTKPGFENPSRLTVGPNRLDLAKLFPRPAKVTGSSTSSLATPKATKVSTKSLGAK